MANDRIVGKLVEGDLKNLIGKSPDPSGEILSRTGAVIGKCERWEPEPEAEPEPEPEQDLSALNGATVTQMGYLVIDNKPVGRVVEGVLQHLIGKRADENGIIWDSGKQLGKAALLTDSEREELTKESGPFGDFPDAFLDGENVIANRDTMEIIGKLVEETLRL